MRQPVRRRDVVERGLDVFDGAAVLLDRADRSLVLVQQRDRADEGEILHVIAPRARPVVEERQPLGERVHDAERPQEPLRVAMQAEHGGARLRAQQTGERFALALQAMDRRRLLPAFVHRQHEAAV